MKPSNLHDIVGPVAVEAQGSKHQETKRQQLATVFADTCAMLIQGVIKPSGHILGSAPFPPTNTFTFSISQDGCVSFCGLN